MKNSTSLKKNSDFKKVYNLGQSRANRYLVMYILENGLNINRLGISVSKKVGNSVIRHHITRLVRENYRVKEDRYHIGYDIVVIARNQAKDITYKDVDKSFEKLAGLHGIIKD